MLTSTPLFVGGLPGGMEWAVILLIAVLLFGANKIPKLARSSGQAIGEFQKGREEVEEELENMREEATPGDSGSENADATSETQSSTESSGDSDSTSSN